MAVVDSEYSEYLSVVSLLLVVSSHTLFCDVIVLSCLFTIKSKRHDVLQSSAASLLQA